MPTRDEMMDNLQEVLAFMPGRDRIEVCERKLVEAAAGFDNLTVVSALVSLLTTIIAANPSAADARANAHDIPRLIESGVHMLLDKMGR